MEKINNLLNYVTHERPENEAWILLIHGAGGSIRTWKRQVEDLGAKYNLIIVDLPGHGGTTFNESDGFTAKDMALRVHQLTQVLGELFWEKANELPSAYLSLSCCFIIVIISPCRCHA